MISIEHSLKFVTTLDENDPTAKRLLALSHDDQVGMLEGLLKAVIAPRLAPILKDVNEGNSWATLEVVA